MYNLKKKELAICTLSQNQLWKHMQMCDDGLAFCVTTTHLSLVQNWMFYSDEKKSLSVVDFNLF